MHKIQFFKVSVLVVLSMLLTNFVQKFTYYIQITPGQMLKNKHFTIAFDKLLTDLYLVLTLP